MLSVELWRHKPKQALTAASCTSHIGLYQSCRRTASRPTSCVRTQIATWPSNGVSTFRETRLAVGFFRDRVGYAPVQPTVGLSMGIQKPSACTNSLKIAIGRMRKRSMNKNYASRSVSVYGKRVRQPTWKSPRFEAEAYRKLTEVNWMAEYRLMYLKQQKLVTRAARPSLCSV